MSIKWNRTDLQLGGYVDNDPFEIVSDDSHSFLVVVNKQSIYRADYEMKIIKVDRDGILVNAEPVTLYPSSGSDPVYDASKSDKFGQFVDLRLVGDYLYLAYMETHVDNESDIDDSENFDDDEASGLMRIIKLDKDLNRLVERTIDDPSDLNHDKNAVGRIFVANDKVYTGLLFEKDGAAYGENVFIRLHILDTDDLTDVGSAVEINCNVLNNGVTNSSGDVVIDLTTELTTGGFDTGEEFFDNRPLSDIYVDSDENVFVMYKLYNNDDDDERFTLLNRVDTSGDKEWAELLVDPFDRSLRDFMTIAVGINEEDMYCGFNNVDRETTIAKINKHTGAQIWTTSIEEFIPSSSNTEKGVIVDNMGNPLMLHLRENFEGEDRAILTKFRKSDGKNLGSLNPRDYIQKSEDLSNDNCYLALNNNTAYLLMRVKNDVREKYQFALVKYNVGTGKAKVRELFREMPGNLEAISAVQFAQTALRMGKQYSYRYKGRNVSGEQTFSAAEIVSAYNTAMSGEDVSLSSDTLWIDYVEFLRISKDILYVYQSYRQSKLHLPQGRSFDFMFKLHYSDAFMEPGIVVKQRFTSGELIDLYNTRSLEGMT